MDVCTTENILGKVFYFAAKSVAVFVIHMQLLCLTVCCSLRVYTVHDVLC